MRVLAGLLYVVVLVCVVKANIEKTIFIAPRPLSLTHVRLSVGDLRLHALSPLRPILPLQLPVRFPSQPMPHGLESWYLLRRLQDGRRYEVRMCWPATQPTDFRLDTFSITQVQQTPQLVASLAQYSDGIQDLEVAVQDDSFLHDESLLFLRVQAAASYFSTNRTLMAFPAPVDVDIILDPFILNIFPRSLAPFALYVSAVAVGAWFLSDFIYRWLFSITAILPGKPHTD